MTMSGCKAQPCWVRAKPERSGGSQREANPAKVRVGERRVFARWLRKLATLDEPEPTA
ncbi:MAG: hypothetical protein QM523_03080 [Candidatus Pacebacteria bacterium]|nr:hypothetical protein [Candidatus Paceibacterota bacterium]